MTAAAYTPSSWLGMVEVNVKNVNYLFGALTTSSLLSYTSIGHTLLNMKNMMLPHTYSLTYGNVFFWIQDWGLNLVPTSHTV